MRKEQQEEEEPMEDGGGGGEMSAARGHRTSEAQKRVRNQSIGITLKGVSLYLSSLSVVVAVYLHFKMDGTQQRQKQKKKK